MRRACGLLVICGLSAVTLFAQTNDGYQQVYREWQQDDVNLVHDASDGAKDLTPRTVKAAVEAGKFVSARKEFYDEQRAQLADKVKSLEAFELPGETDAVKTAEAVLSSQETAIASSVELFGGDSDPAIQRLRQALEKERQALIMLKNSIDTRGNVMEVAKTANERVNHASTDVATQVKAISASFTQSEQNADQLSEAWPYYYRALADGSRGLQITDPFPASLSALSRSEPGANSSAARNAEQPTSRFAGSWRFVFGVSAFHGLLPLSFDVVVREEDSQLSGTVKARFMVTGKADPDVEFSFSGPIQATQSQSFALRTAQGAKGTVELIPGVAPNLTEVNFRLDGVPGKVRESDVVVVKR